METVVAFDIGTTHLKWITVEMASGQVVAHGQTLIEATARGPASEQDPVRIGSLMEGVLRKARESGAVQSVGLSAAMHTFMAVDGSGRPLTQSWTWMDQRAAPAAQHVRQSVAESQALRAVTGVPVHAMSPLMKWMAARPALPADARPVALKDFLVYQLTGTWTTDYSTASASGFLGLDGRWSDRALALAAIDASQLPAVRMMADRVKSREGSFDVVIGGTDAAMAHGHLHIPSDGSVAVVAMGTSGAMRVTSTAPAGDPALFCYTMGPDAGYLVGSAFSNVGNVLEWLGSLFGLSVDQILEQGIEAIRSGRRLPRALPYWHGERSPWWREDLTGSWAGMGPGTTSADLAGATILAITASYWQGLEALRRVGAPVREVRAGSGLMAHPVMGQWMADALSRDIVFYDERDASLMGAVDLARNHPPAAPAESRRFRPQGDWGARVAAEWECIRTAMAGL